MKKILLGLVLMLMAATAALAGGTDAEQTLTVAMAAAPAGMAVVGAFDAKKITCATEAEFTKLKAANRHLYVLDIVMSKDESYQFLVCRPSRALLSLVASAESTDQANDYIIKNMVVAGDTSVLDDGLVYARLNEQLSALMKEGKGFLHKA